MRCSVALGSMEPRSDSRPPYLVVADQLRRRIVAGEFASGDQLPAGRELAEEYGVAPNTVLSAIRLLRDEGLVASQQGRGTFVRDVDLADVGSAAGSPEYQELLERLEGIQSLVESLDARVREIERTVQPSSGEPAEG